MPFLDPLCPPHPRLRTRTRYGMLVVAVKDSQATLVCRHGEAKEVGIAVVDKAKFVCDACVEETEREQDRYRKPAEICFGSSRSPQPNALGRRSESDGCDDVAPLFLL